MIKSVVVRFCFIRGWCYSEWWVKACCSIWPYANNNWPILAPPQILAQYLTHYLPLHISRELYFIKSDMGYWISLMHQWHSFSLYSMLILLFHGHSWIYMFLFKFGFFLWSSNFDCYSLNFSLLLLEKDLYVSNLEVKYYFFK